MATCDLMLTMCYGGEHTQNDAECVLSREGVRGADAAQIEAMLTNIDDYVTQL